MAFKIKDLDGELGEVVEQVGIVLGEKLIEESQGEYQLFCTTSCYHIPTLHINIHWADIFIYEEDMDSYELTGDIFLVFDTESKEFLYSEQGGSLCTCIHNYCNLILNQNVNMDMVEDLDCVYTLDKGKILDEYIYPSDNLL